MKIPGIKKGGRRLAVYTEAVSGGGIGRYTYELCRALDRRGLDIQFIAPGLVWEEEYGAVSARRRLLPTPGGRWRPVKVSSLIYRSLAGMMTTLWIGRSEPIVFSHLVGIPPFSMFGFLGARISGARSVLLLHDFYPHKLRFWRWLQWLERASYRWTYRRFDLIVALTEAQLPLLSALGIPPQRLAQIPHGVFPLAGISRPSHAEPLTLLAFGNIRQNKKTLETVVAVQELRAEGVVINLVIAGSALREEQKYWDACQRQIGAAPDGISIIGGFVPEADLPKLISGVHAFVCPYENFDSQSGVATIALSNGVPLIATASVGLPGVVKDFCHVIAGVPDVASIKTAIRSFLACTVAEREARAVAAQDSFLDQRSWDRIGESLETRLQEAGFWGPRA